MKKIFLTIVFLGSALVMAENAQPPMETFDEKFKAELSRIIQAQQIFKNIAIEYTLEFSYDDERTWEKNGDYRLVWDRSENSLYLIKKKITKNKIGNIVEESSEKIFSNGILTSIDGSSLIDDSTRKAFPPIVSISKATDWMDPFLKSFVNYSNISDTRPLIADNLISFEKPRVSLTEYNGKASLCVESAHKPSMGMSNFTFFFDVKTGLLLEKKISMFKKNDGKMEEGILSRLIISDYVSYNGFFFPAEATQKFSNGTASRIKVNKKTAKINEKLDQKIFYQKIPSGSKVYDKINGTTYVAPSIGNIAAEEQIAKELDELFKKATAN